MMPPEHRPSPVAGSTNVILAIRQLIHWVVQTFWCVRVVDAGNMFSDVMSPVSQSCDASSADS